MTVRLVVRQRGEEKGSASPSELLLDDDLITLGRDKACQVVLPQRAVSRNHARISQDGPLFFVEDLGSAYGTQVNGHALPKGEKRLLRNGDVIAIAQFDVTFEKAPEPKAEGGKSEKTSFVARQAVKDAMRGLAGKPDQAPYFRLMNGPREGERLELPEAQELTVGREPGVELVLDDDLVSRRHAKIRRDWSGTHVEDLGSRNGIRVNKKRFSRRTLKDKDELEIGSTRMLFVDPTAVEPEVAPEPSSLSLAGEHTNHDQEVEAPLADSPANPVLSDAPQAAAAAAAAAEPAESPPIEEPPPADEPPPEDDEPPPDEDDEPKKPGLLGDAEKQRKIVVLAAVGVVVLIAAGLVLAVLVGV